jgi:hypothetical protein
LRCLRAKRDAANDMAVIQDNVIIGIERAAVKLQPSLELPADQIPIVRQAQIAETSRRLIENRLAYYKPYPKQIEFHAARARHRERLLMAGNQLGKTLAGGFEVSKFSGT